jgi:hypothetical protein
MKRGKMGRRYFSSENPAAVVEAALWMVLERHLGLVVVPVCEATRGRGVDGMQVVWMKHHQELESRMERAS